MPTESSNSARLLLLAITEEDSPAELMRSALRALGESQGELMALFVTDERWVHAATLPFTCEVSAVSGQSQDFTPQRAEEVVRERAAKMRRELERLAKEAELTLRFAIAAADMPDLEQLVGASPATVIASHRFLQCRAYASIKALPTEFVLIDEAD